MDGSNEQTPAPADSATFVLPRRGWLKLHEHRGRSLVLLLAGIVATAAGLLGAVRRVDEFQRLDFRPSGGRGLPRGQRQLAHRGRPRGPRVGGRDRRPRRRSGGHNQRPRTLPIRASGIDVVGDARRQATGGRVLPPRSPRWTCAICWSRSRPCSPLQWPASSTWATRPAGWPLPRTRRGALRCGGGAPPHDPNTSWQWLLLVRDFGRLALPPLLIAFFASFPARIKHFSWLWAAFLPSSAVAAGRTALAAGLLPPVVGDVLLPEAFDTATAVLAVLGVLAAAALSIRAYVSHRADPTRRRQVEWVALGAAAGFTPYLLLSLIPQWAGARLEVLTWVSLLPLALVPLGVASSLLEFRLWDLEDIARQVLATGVAVILGGISFAFLNLAVTQFGFRLGNWRNLVAVAGGVLLATLTVPARRLLLEGMERLQYRERLAARRALTTFAEEAVAHHDPETLLQRLAQLLRDALAVDRVVTYLALGGRLYPSGTQESWPILSDDQVRGTFPTQAELAWWNEGCGTASPSRGTGG